MRAHTTLRYFYPLITGVVLLLASFGGVHADTSRGDSGPGFDRVGKVVTGGMRGNQIDTGPRAQVTKTAESSRDGEPAEANLNRRKVELTKRMFWIMLSMR